MEGKLMTLPNRPVIIQSGERQRTLAPDARPRSLLGWVWAVLVAVGRWVWEW